MGLIFQSVPTGSLQLLPPERREQYFSLCIALPSSLRSMMFDAQTGSYIRGLVKSHQIPETQAPMVAFAVLRIVVGEKTLAELPGLLSAELGIANDKAQRIATEIEKDLLAPVALELNRYLENRNKKLPHYAKATRGGENRNDMRPMNNVLNLKDMKKPPMPPKIDPSAGGRNQTSERGNRDSGFIS